MLLDTLSFPEPWKGDVEATLPLIDTITFQIHELEEELITDGADHRYVALLRTVPGISHVLGYTIAAEIGDITRFATPTKLCGDTGLCPRVYQSGDKDHRGSLAKNGPTYLRWALIEAATHARATPSTPSATGAPPFGSAASVARRSPASKSPETRRSHLAHVDQRPTVRSGKAHVSLWPHDGPQLRWTSLSSPIYPT